MPLRSQRRPLACPINARAVLITKFSMVEHEKETKHTHSTAYQTDHQLKHVPSYPTQKGMRNETLATAKVRLHCVANLLRFGCSILKLPSCVLLKRKRLHLASRIMTGNTEQAITLPFPLKTSGFRVFFFPRSVQVCFL